MGFGWSSRPTERLEIFLLRGTFPGCDVYHNNPEALFVLHDELDITAGHYHRVDKRVLCASG